MKKRNLLAKLINKKYLGYCFSFIFILISFISYTYGEDLTIKSTPITNISDATPPSPNNTTAETIKSITDKEAPKIQITYPPNETTTTKTDIIIKGKLTDNIGLKTFIINNASYGISGNDNSFSIPLKLKYGVNTIIVKAIDNSNNTSSKNLTVFLTAKKITSKNKFPESKISKNIKIQPKKIITVENNLKDSIPDKKPPAIQNKKTNKDEIKITSNSTKPLLNKIVPKKQNKIKPTSPKKVVLKNKKYKKISKKFTHYYKKKKIKLTKHKITIIIKNREITSRTNLIKNRTFVALNTNLAKSINVKYNITHNSPTKVIFSRDTKNIIFTQNKRNILNEKHKIIRTLDFSPFLSNGQIMIPLRALAESFGYTVHWDNISKTVYIW